MFLSLALAACIYTATASPLTHTVDSSLLVTSAAPSLDLPACLQQAYRGVYGGSPETQEHIYLASSDCLGSVSFDSLSSGSIIPLAHDDSHIVWVGPAGVHPDLLEDVEHHWNFISSRAALHSSTTQKVFAVEPEIFLLRQSPHSLLLQVPGNLLPIIDTLLPPHLVPVALSAAWEPVPSHLAENLARITKNLTFSPELDKILAEGLNLDDLRRNVRWLTGEGPSGIESRHSFTSGALRAADWIKSKVEATGANCTLQPFLDGFAPNVICHYASSLNSTEQVLLSAHYDSRGSFGKTRAPGGDDDGSGSGHLLAVAEAIASQRVRFEGKVTLAFFAGEEQGLLGSHYYAELLHSTNATVLLQIQADMLAYHDVSEPLQLGLPESIGTPEATYLLGNLSQLYSPELVVGRTEACCSDHQSFVAYGFPATQVFERNGWIIDPMYHNSGDLSQRDNYDFDQVVAIAKVTMAAVLTVAGYKIGK